MFFAVIAKKFGAPQETKETELIKIQSTDTFHKSCKKPAAAINTGLRGRKSNLTFSRNRQIDTFEGSRLPQPEAIPAAKSSTLDKVKTWTVGTLGATMLGLGLMPARVR